MKITYIFIILALSAVTRAQEGVSPDYAEGRLVFLTANLGESKSPEKLKLDASELAWCIISAAEDGIYSEKLAILINQIEDTYGPLEIADSAHFVNDRNAMRARQWKFDIALNSRPQVIFEITRRAREIYIEKGFPFPEYSGKVYGKL
jgi:hypothetical protein